MSPILSTYLAPALALAVAALGALLGQSKRRRHLLPAAGPLAALVGWAALLPWGAGGWREAWSPRNGPEVLLLPAAAALVSLALRSGKGARWAAVALVLFVAWWVAGTPVARPEFWRVWAGTALLCLAFARSVRGQPDRALASAAGLWLGLLLAGASWGWRQGALVMLAASVGTLPAGAGVGMPGALMAALVAAADLGTGRLVRAGVGLADAACLASLVAPWLVPAVAGRVGKRLGPAGPLVCALLAGALAAAMAWLLQRALIR